MCIRDSVNSLVLMPWGGNSDFAMPRSPRSQLIVYLAGPFVNCAVFLLGTALLVQSDFSKCVDLINPVDPRQFDPQAWQRTLIEIFTWINFQLMLINLILCYPFDGASAVRSLIGMMNVDVPKLRVESAIKLFGTAVAIAFIGMAWFVRDMQVGPVHPTWLLCLLIGITLLFSANYSLYIETRADDSEWDDVEEMDYDSIYSESSFFDLSNETENAAYSQWLQEKQEARRQIEMRKEKEEDRRADEILKKLHGDGLASLTEEERSILNRVSARLRRRRQQGVQ